MSKPKSNLDDLRDWIEYCLDNLQKLSQWEQNFVESLSAQLEERGSLSQAQIDVLERIYAKV